MDYKAMLLKMLGLEATATDEQIQAKSDEASAAIKNCATVKDENATLKNRVGELEKKELEKLVNSDLEEFKDVITDKEAVKVGLLANRESTRKILQALKPVGKALNAEGAKAPDNKDSVDFAAKLQKQRDYVQEVKLKNNLSSEVRAYDIARLQKPELFD